MNRQQKELVVKLLKERFSESPASFVVGYKGLAVDQMQGLRSQLRKEGGALKVTKARLMKLAVEGAENAQGLMPYLKDQIGVVFAANDPSAVAKALSEFAKQNEALELIAGELDGSLLDKAGINRIATLPSREVLLGQVCGTLNAPITKLAFVLNMQIMQLLLVLKQVEAKKNN